VRSGTYVAALQRWEVCILAGGLSARMGRDKARLRLGRRTLLGWVKASARALGAPVRVVRRDLVRRCGPLGGVYTALVTSRAERILFLSCDMPFVSPALLPALIARMTPRDQALFAAEENRFGFPFILRADALPVVHEQLSARQFSLQRLARRLNARRVQLPRRFRAQLFNINTPADWAVARQRRSQAVRGQ
jgi:molybdopterin-guanine dinucleotide biosynthesis protein A